MNRRIEDLGRHPGLATKALTKEEVAAALCDAGHRAGFWSIPEFEIRGLDRVRRRIDVVWASRQLVDANHIWLPAAAFEIEGHRVAAGSVRKNVDSLQAAMDRGTVVSAMVLFQVGPDLKPWGRASAATSLLRAETYMAQFKRERSSTCPIEVVMDELLYERLGAWVESIASQRAHAADECRGGPRC